MKHIVILCLVLAALRAPVCFGQNGGNAGLVTDFTDDSEAPLVVKGDYVLRGTVLVQYRGTTGEVIIPANLGITEIGGEAFAHSKVISAVIPAGIEKIHHRAFWNCNKLVTVTIPASVTTVENSAFFYCSSLNTIQVDRNNPAYSSADGVLFSKDKRQLLCYPAGKAGRAYTVPAGTAAIGDNAFYYCGSLSSITIPAGLTRIGDGAFYECDGLVSINIPPGVTGIGAQAFYKCGSLAGITLPASLTSIGDGAFFYCGSLRSITLPAGLTRIGDDTFSGCRSLSSITIPRGVTGIGEWAFSRCGALASISIPSGVTSIGAWAFYECAALRSVSIPNSLVSIGKGAFYGCSALTGLTLPASVTRIGEGILSGCTSLEAITVDSGNTAYAAREGVLFNKNCTVLLQYPIGKKDSSYLIPPGVTSIRELAFYGCSWLTSITIPRGVISIGNEAFYMSGLKTVELFHSTWQGANVFPSGCVITVYED